MYPNQYATSYENFIEHAKASSLPGVKNVVEDIIAGRKRLIDKDIYAMVDASGKTNVDFFETDKLKGIGARNIAQAQLPEGQIMLVDKIFLLGVTSEAEPYTFDSLYSENFGTIKGIAGIQNGQVMFSVEKKIVLDEFSLQHFVTDGLDNVPVGMYALNSAHLLNHSVEIKFEIDLPAAIPAKTGLKLVLSGVGTAPN